jgi:hypothetical protein
MQLAFNRKKKEIIVKKEMILKKKRNYRIEEKKFQFLFFLKLASDISKKPEII